MDYSTHFRDVLGRYDSNSQVVTFSWFSNKPSGPRAIHTYSILPDQELFLSIHVLSNFV